MYIIHFYTKFSALFLFLEAWIFPSTSQSTFKGVFSALGITLITGSTISFIIEIFMRLDLVDFMVARMLLILPNELKNNAGVAEFHEDRKVINFEKIWDDAEEYLKIIGLSANDILAPSRMPLLKKKIMANPNFNLHILLINPWSIMAQQRSTADVYGTKHECVKRVYSILVELKDTYDNLKMAGVNVSNFDVRLYDAIPSLSMVIDKNHAIITPFTVASQGGSSPYFIAKNILTNSCVYDLYEKHFDLIWGKSISVFQKGNETIFLETIEKEKLRSVGLPRDITEWLQTIYTTHN